MVHGSFMSRPNTRVGGGKMSFAMNHPDPIHEMIEEKLPWLQRRESDQPVPVFVFMRQGGTALSCG
jgi:hypothetical protein